MTSNNLNAEEMAAKRYKDEHEPDAVINVSPYQWVRLGYSCAIREVAQPIADERDELREALDEVLGAHEAALIDGIHEAVLVHNMDTYYDIWDRRIVMADAKVRAILAKYPKP